MGIDNACCVLPLARISIRALVHQSKKQKRLLDALIK